MASTQITFESSLTDLCEVNSSFDSGILRIAYPGKNRNKTLISKETFERCVKTMYNCPIACNYDRETDSLGGHDVEVVRDANENLKLCNLTTPIGCIPESARHWWATVTEEDGTEREYLHTDVLLWKRQEAYEKIKRDGIAAHSMEINVKSGKMVDGYFEIEDFEFTAFVLIGVEPCFESSAIEMFSMNDFKSQLEEMMNELKELYSKVGTSEEVKDRFQFYNDTEGGNDLDEMIKNNEAASDVQAGTENTEEEFALTDNMVEELSRAVEAIETICREWGEYPRYCYADSDFEEKEVYAWDRQDWILYGFKYSTDGDAVTIDVESKSRKKYVIADYEGGEQPSPFPQVFELMLNRISSNSELEKKYSDASSELEAAQKELGDLRSYKQENEEKKFKAEIQTVFEKFNDIAEVDDFKVFKEKLENKEIEMSVEDITEKCFALRGRYGTLQFSARDQKEPKIIVEKTKHDDQPYGGIVEKYSN